MEWFALVVLIVIALVVIGIAVVLAMVPGKVARERNHPQADAVAVCGWWGLLTAGLLLPLAWIWAFSAPAPEMTNEELSE